MYNYLASQVGIELAFILNTNARLEFFLFNLRTHILITENHITNNEQESKDFYNMHAVDRNVRF